MARESHDNPSAHSGVLGNRKARKVRRGIRKGKLRVHRARKGKVNDERGLFYQGSTRGKHLRNTRSKMYRGA
jgi:hypothetical protein